MKRNVLSPMGWFTLRYLFWAPFLFLFFYFDSFSPFIFINQLETDLNVFLMQQWISFHAIPVTMIGPDIFFHHGLHLTVVNECNGMAAFFLFLASVLSYPTPGSPKIFYALFGYLVILLANTVRLVGITYYVIDHPESFALLHEVVGRYVIAGIPLVLFYFFSQHSPRRRRTDKPLEDV
ncbi:MAG: exosortase/archaeosortase family protein [Sulfuricurvum sp.]|nr:exosortase/archaeosortase family protein [Sulfuricurvum sp.]MDP3464590.1 exosortase/archaeosortase family protein [Sulfuricurvum sp.]